MKFIRRHLYVITVMVVVCVVILLILVKIKLRSQNEVEEEIVKEEEIFEGEEVDEVSVLEEVEESQYVVVDVKGAVKNPGVYQLEEGKRVTDAINMAGGLGEGANTSLINLAAILEDSMVVIVYTNREVLDYKDSKTIVSENYSCPDVTNDVCICEEDVITVEQDKSNVSSEETTGGSSTKISINKATLEELMTISGIGESKARAIIEYRESKGAFKTIEDIKQVSGIGDSLYEKIKEYITI